MNIGPLITTVSTRKRWLILALLLLMVASAFADIVSIGLLVPLIALLAEASAIDAHPWAAGLAETLAGENRVEAVLAGFAVAVILAATLRVAVARMTQTLAFGMAYDLEMRVFRTLLRRDYRWHLDHHSGDALGWFEKISDVTFSVFLSGLQAIAATVIGVIVLAFLVAILPLTATIAALALVAAYLVTALALRRTYRRNSKIASEATTRRIKSVQRALGGIRDVILDRSYRIFERSFERASKDARQAYVSTGFAMDAPRIVIEAIGIVVMVMIALYLARGEGGLGVALPTLGALALGAQRLLPLAQMAFNGWSSLISSSSQIDEVATAIASSTPRQEDDGEEKIRDFSQIRLENVSFRYRDGEQVLSQIDLSIGKGEWIGISGPTGAGKSTLVDILLGLLEPTAGLITIDDQLLDATGRAEWQRTVAHVPQDIFLSEESVAANIAFGVSDEERDPRLVERSARLAGLDQVVARLPAGFDTPVGERGLWLSGGQRQRVAIARALYREPRLIVLDEATSALDRDTESAILSELHKIGRDITIVFVSHRDEVLNRCDRVIRLHDGQIVNESGQGLGADSEGARG